MGLFVTEDGHFQGWLAAFLCCCAAINDDESPAENKKSSSSNQTNGCYEQPQPMQHSTSTSTLDAFKKDGPTTRDNPRSKFTSDRPPSLNPLDFEEKPLVSSWSHRASPRGSPSISAPYEFRRLDQTESQRQGLIPLRLGPVVLRDSPSDRPDYPITPQSALSRDNKQFGSTDDLLADDARPQSYRENRESPFQRCRQQSNNTKPLQYPDEQVEVHAKGFTDNGPTPTRPPLALTPVSNLVIRSDAATPIASTKPRTTSERARLKRKHSLPVLRKDERLEQEVLELNTIVEERRAESVQNKRSSQHVPAVAPAMQVRARSETLNSIGSALSRAVSTRVKRDQQRVWDTVTPERNAVQRPESASSWPSSRFSGSISDVLLSSSPPRWSNGEPFYKCQMPGQQQQRRASEASASTWLTEPDSPSFATSSPVSKGHSRHATDESRTTPLSPCTPRDDTYSRGLSRDGKEVQWPFFTMTNTEVGVAF